MRFKLILGCLLFAGLYVCLTSDELWLRNALAFNTSRIVFTSTRDGNAEIYVMDADGDNQERLTYNTADDVYPTWSPDRTKIAFIRGLSQIHVMDAHGKHTIKLTDRLRKKEDLDWSLDGQKIAFTSWNGQKPHIIVMDADGNNAFKLTDGVEPSWSPDGQRIAFSFGRDREDQIHVIGVDGNGLKKVTRDLAVKGTPAWSPDGQQIAYMALLHERIFQIYVVGADGRNRKRLTHKQEHHMDPSWSPDGQTIAYVWSPDVLINPPTKIHVMTADGKYLKQLSDDHNGNEYYPDFGPVRLAVSPTSKTATTWSRLKKHTSNLR